MISAALLPGASAARGRHRLARLLAAVAGSIVLAVIALINIDVFARALLDRPLRGVPEFVSLAIPMMTFLAVPWLAVANGLIRAGLLARWLAGGGRTWAAGFTLAFELIAGILAVAIAFTSLPWLLRAVSDREFIGVDGDFTAPLWPARLAVVLGSALLGVYAVGASVGALARLRSPGACLPLLVLTLPVFYLVAAGPAAIGALSVGVLFVLLVSGIPVVFALMSAATLGIAFIRHDAMIAVETLALAANGAVASYVFAAVPLFVFLGLVVGRADIGRDALSAAHWLLGRLVGGLGVATVFANAVFAAITGISIASAAIFSKVAVPPLIAHGFTPRFAVGLVAGSSVLGMLIPPSLLLIVYGLIAEVSINVLFVAAIVPGLLLTACFTVGVMVAASRGWRWAVSGRGLDRAGEVGDARVALRNALPIALLIVAVLGGIYAGVFTPTEAGAVGSALALLLSLAMRRLRGAEVGRMLFEAAATSASILFLIIGASAFGMMLTLSGIPDSVGAWAAHAGFGLGGYTVVYLAILVVLGMVLDSTSILLIMVPLALPTVKALGGDLVWFGIVTVIGVEIGLLTPPLGLSVFAIKSSLDDESISLNDIFLGALPFAALMLALTLVLIEFPFLSTMLL